MTVIILNKILMCVKCGKEEKADGVMLNPGKDSFGYVCRKCRSEMKSTERTLVHEQPDGKLTTVQIKAYEDGWQEVSGFCEVCRQFPCYHSDKLYNMDAKKARKKRELIKGDVVELPTNGGDEPETPE